MMISYQLGKSPASYYDVSNTALEKSDKIARATTAEADDRSDPLDPLNHRILSIFTALYRIESGATFRTLLDWLEVHPQLHGGYPGRDFADVSWDAQSDLEHAHYTKE